MMSQWLTFTIVILSFSVSATVGDNVLTNYIAGHVDVKYTVLDNLNKTVLDQFIGQIELTNTGHENIEENDWEIYFCSVRLMEAQILQNLTISHMGAELGDSNVKVYHVNGCLHKLSPTTEFSALNARSTLVLPFKALFWSVQRTDLMPRWMVTSADGNGEAKVISSTAGEDLGYVANFTEEKQWKRTSDDRYNPIQPNDRYNSNEGRGSDLDVSKRPVLPTPHDEQYEHSYVNIMTGDWAVVYMDETIMKEAQFLATHLRMEVLPANQTPSSRYVVLHLDPGLSTNQETYECHVMDDVINITGSSAAGVFYGVQTLLSLSEEPNGVPLSTIKDHPRFPFRGMHIDVGRNFFDKDDIMTIIDVMAMYKLNKFHFHLTDDEGWRLEIPGIPEATEIGSRRCFDLNETLCILPQLGSGPRATTSGSGYYTVQDYREILQFAADRHIEVIPEFDMPGHGHAIIKAMEARYRAYADTDMTKATEYLLSDADDESMYYSVQYFTDNAINPCMNSTYDFIRHLVTQVKEMHQDIQPLKVFHFGGDEVGKTAWESSPICQQLVDENPDININDNTTTMRLELQKYFAIRLAKIVAAEDLDLAGWEDGLGEHKIPFNRSELENKNVYMNAWNNIWEWEGGDLAYIFANADYQVILGHATHLYFDHPQEPDPEERGFYWAARYTDTYKTFSYYADNVYNNMNEYLTGEPLDKDVFCEPEDRCIPLQDGKAQNIIGMQGHLWSETVRTRDQLHSMIFPRMIALAERAWHRPSWEDNLSDQQRSRDWEMFANTLGYKEFARLDKMGVQYYVPPPGAMALNFGAYTILEANVMFPGLPIQYSVNGGQTWSGYHANHLAELPFQTDVMIRTSSRSGDRHSRVVVVTTGVPGPEEVSSCHVTSSWPISALLLIASVIFHGFYFNRT